MARFFETLKMLISQAIPNSVIPYFDVAYGQPASVALWIVGIAMIALIICGFWRFGKLRYFLIAYPAFLIGLISMWSTPSENRYIASLVPILDIGMILGIYYLINTLAATRLKMVKKEVTPWVMALFLLFTMPHLKAEREINQMEFPPQYKNFFAVAEEVKKQLPPETVVASRKPSLFYMHSQGKIAIFAYSSDDKKVIEGFLNDKVDYVVLDELGYSATALYLYPAIEKNPELFTLALQMPNSNTYLLRFEKEKAKALLGL